MLYHSFNEIAFIFLDLGEIIVFTPTPIIKNNLFSILYVSCKIPHTFLLFINRSFGFFILIFKFVYLDNSFFKIKDLKQKIL